MKLISMLTAVATVALSSAAFAGGPARVQIEQEVKAPEAPAAVPSSWGAGAGAIGPGAIAAGLLGVVALGAVLSDSDSGSSTGSSD